MDLIRSRLNILLRVEGGYVVKVAKLAMWNHVVGRWAMLLYKLGKLALFRCGERRHTFVGCLGLRGASCSVSVTNYI